MSGKPETIRVSNPVLLGAAIRRIRQQSGMTQAELAERSGIHASYLSQLERGHVSEQTERILRVLRRLGTSISIEIPE